MSTVTVQQAFELAFQHHQAGRLADADAIYRQILAAYPQHAEALHHAGLIALSQGRAAEAEELIRRAVTLHPLNALAHNNHGEALRALGRFAEAETAYRRALEINPQIAEIHSNLGNALTLQGRLEEAIAAYRRTLEMKPGYAQAYSNLGSALTELKRYPEAAAALRQAIALAPQFAEAYVNLGGVLIELGQNPAAMEACQHAIALQPGLPSAHYNLGSALNEQARYDEAIAAFRRALELNPQYAEPQLAMSLALLTQGHFEQGWPLYEQRWQVYAYTRRDLPQPLWEGEPIAGKRVLIQAEQGLGDAIQFVRYAELIAQRGGEVVVECLDSLRELFRTARGIAELVTKGEPLPPCDARVPTLSLPRVFQTRRETIPQTVPYLFADPARVTAWAQRIGARGERRRIGLVWGGNPLNRLSRKRDIPLEKFCPLLAIPGVEFFSLQVGPGAEQLEKAAGFESLANYTAQLTDLAETAALLTHLDLVISADTAVAHLAGALGRPVWTLIPFVPDWRWGAAGEDTPWYPTMRLFRQPSAGDWDSVVQRVASELA